MECAEDCCEENASPLESLMNTALWFSLGAFFSGMAALLFIFWHGPNFPHPQNFFERYITEKYNLAVLSEAFIVFLSGAYALFSTIRLRFGWIGHFSLTFFFLGVFVSLAATEPWYHLITQQNSHIDKSLVFVSFAGCFDSFLLLEREKNCLKIAAFILLVVSFLLFPITFNHDIHRAEAVLQQSYKEAKSFPKTLSYSMNWSNVRSSEVRSDLQNLGGYGAMIAAKAYQRAGYEMPVVVWDNLMRLGQYVNVLQSRGLLSGGVPWQITPKAGTLRHLRRLEPYYRFFQHPNRRFYLHHSSVSFFQRYRQMQALHQGDFFTRKLASLAKAEAVGRWVEPRYEK